MMLQITEVQSKINVLSTKVRENVGEVFRLHSEHFDDLDKSTEEEEEKDEGDFDANVTLEA